MDVELSLLTELKSCVKIEVDKLGSLTARMVFVDGVYGR